MLLKNLLNKISAQSTYNLAITNCCLLCLSPARSHYFGSKTISHPLHGWTAEILLLGCVSSSLNLVHFFVLFLSLHLISFSSKTSMLTLLFLCGYSIILVQLTVTDTPQKQRMAAYLGMYLGIWQPKIRKKISRVAVFWLFSSNYLK